MRCRGSLLFLVISVVNGRVCVCSLFVAWRVGLEDEQGTRRQVATQALLKTDAMRCFNEWCVCVWCRVGAVAGYFCLLFCFVCGSAAEETLLEMMLTEFRPEIHAELLRGCRVLQLQLQ